jgi:hypothetical protein
LEQLLKTLHAEEALDDYVVNGVSAGELAREVDLSVGRESHGKRLCFGRLPLPHNGDDLPSGITVWIWRADAFALLPATARTRSDERIFSGRRHIDSAPEEIEQLSTLLAGHQPTRYPPIGLVQRRPRADYVEEMSVPRVMALRRPDVCVACGSALEASTRAEWNPSLKVVTCLACVEKRTEGEPELPSAEPPSAASSFERGTPGASARRKYDKLHTQRESPCMERRCCTALRR